MSDRICVIIGASHGGVNAAFALRKNGWDGEIIIYDRDPEFPYHRPPLSKGYLTADDQTQQDLLFPEQNYESDNIRLRLGKEISAIHREDRTVTVSDGSIQKYDKLILATGASAFIPPIEGVANATKLFVLRTAADAIAIKKALKSSKRKEVVLIGGGYIGLETAASLKKVGASVTILEREDRVLARVTSVEMSDFFQELHQENGVSIVLNKNVKSISTDNHVNTIVCDDGTTYQAAIIVMAVGVNVNTIVAEKAGLDIENGIKVDASARTNDRDIYAIGDCTFHFNPHYQRSIRLESVQNAVDQAKIAAASICGDDLTYDAIPWFWSDQYDIKLQMVGLSQGYNQTIKRVELDNPKCQSVWYFKGDELLAVDAVNNGKAYVLGTRFIKNKQQIDKVKLADVSIPIKPTSFL